MVHNCLNTSGVKQRFYNSNTPIGSIISEAFVYLVSNLFLVGQPIQKYSHLLILANKYIARADIINIKNKLK